MNKIDEEFCTQLLYLVLSLKGHYQQRYYELEYEKAIGKITDTEYRNKMNENWEDTRKYYNSLVSNEKIRKFQLSTNEDSFEKVYGFHVTPEITSTAIECLSPYFIEGLLGNNYNKVKNTYIEENRLWCLSILNKVNYVPDEKKEILKEISNAVKEGYTHKKIEINNQVFEYYLYIPFDDKNYMYAEGDYLDFISELIKNGKTEDELEKIELKLEETEEVREKDKEFEELLEKITKKKQDNEYILDLYLLEGGVVYKEEKIEKNFIVYLNKEEAEKELYNYVSKGINNTYAHLSIAENVIHTKEELYNVWHNGCLDEYEWPEGILIKALRKNNEEVIDETNDEIKKLKTLQETIEDEESI